MSSYNVLVGLFTHIEIEHLMISSGAFKTTYIN